MPLSFLESKVPASVRARGPAARKRMTEDELRYRAGLYRRLGRDKETAARRCLAHLHWGYEMVGKPPVSDREARAIVDGVYR